MRRIFDPEYFFEDVLSIPSGFFGQLGIKAVICDIDNTLVSHIVAQPTKEAREFIESLFGAGIKVALLSNNGRSRVQSFNKTLQCYVYHRSGKPFTGSIKRALKDMGVKKETTAMIGDQLFTDMLAANLAGLHSILVRPIGSKENAFFKFKRMLESGFIKNYEKRRLNGKIM